MPQLQRGRWPLGGGRRRRASTASRRAAGRDPDRSPTPAGSRPPPPPSRLSWQTPAPRSPPAVPRRGARPGSGVQGGAGGRPRAQRPASARPAPVVVARRPIPQHRRDVGRRRHAAHPGDAFLRRHGRVPGPPPPSRAHGHHQPQRAPFLRDLPPLETCPRGRPVTPRRPRTRRPVPGQPTRLSAPKPTHRRRVAPAGARAAPRPPW